MIQILKSDERGHANHGWLDTHFSFSFADYYDPEHTQFRSLRVINEDHVEPGLFGPGDVRIDVRRIAGVVERRAREPEVLV